MRFTSAKSPDEKTLTITFETEGNGYVVGERADIEALADFLRSADVQIHNIHPVQGPNDGLYSFDFTALRTHLNQALKDWPDTEQYKVRFVHPRQPG